jgi:hypothetical protein
MPASAKVRIFRLPTVELFKARESLTPVPRNHADFDQHAVDVSGRQPHDPLGDCESFIQAPLEFPLPR